MGLGSMFGGGESGVDNSSALFDFAKAMRDRADAYDPWVKKGEQARDMSYEEYQKLIKDPNFLQDMISKGFYESPYQKYMQDQVTKRMNYNAANTGMLGSGAAQRALQDELTKMTGQFQNDYIGRGMNSYGLGLKGLEGLTDLGFKSMNAQDSLLEQAAAGQLQGQMGKNAYDAANETDWGAIIGGAIGTGAGAYFGGPQGAAMGGQMGSSLFGKNKGGAPQQGGGMGGGFGGFGGGGAGGGGGMPFGGMFQSQGQGGFGAQGYGGGGGGYNNAGMMPSNGQFFDPSNFNTGSWSY